MVKTLERRESPIYRLNGNLVEILGPGLWCAGRGLAVNSFAVSTEQRVVEEMSKLLAAYDRSRVPLYVQVASVFRQNILAGEWAPGQKIPTLEQLQQKFQVARVTIRQAVEVLSQEGLLEARRGSGTFVAGAPPERQWLKLETTWDTLVASVRENTHRSLKVTRNAAPPLLRPKEGKLAEAYVSLESVQQRGGAAVFSRQVSAVAGNIR